MDSISHFFVALEQIANHAGSARFEPEAGSAAENVMDLQEIVEKWPQVETFILHTAIALVIFIVGWLLSKWANAMSLRIFARRKFDPAMSRFLASLVQYAVLAAAVIAALDRAGVPSTSFVAILGSAGLAIGLALQGSLGNFASGVMILFFRPFTLNDVVTIAGHTGRVEEIGLFATTLVTPDNETIIVPNSQVTGGSITNLTALGKRRARIEVGVAYGTQIDHAISVLRAAADASPLVLKDPDPAIILAGLGASSVDFAILVWAENANFGAMQHQVRHAVYEALHRAKIDIPFNQIVVHQADAAS
jgi:small conductance mechanosensitive channel